MGLLMGLLANHKELISGMVIGWLVRNPKFVIDWLWVLLRRIPGFHDFVAKNAPALIGWLKGAETEVEVKIDEESKNQPPPAAP